MLCEGTKRLAADTVHMPVGVEKVHPLLAAVTASRAFEEVVGSRKGLVKKRNEVVLHGGLLLHVEAEFPVHSFQLVS